jgi:outer membrane protein OmpA-like peptidoglycan-associated protein
MVQTDRPPAATTRKRAGLLLLAVALAPGCGLAPKSRLDDAAKVTQALRAENSQLRDQALRLKGQNDDLAERSLADSRRVAALEQAVDRLETSTQGYIDEREELVDKFQRFRRLAQSSAASSPSTAMTSRLRAFATAHAGTAFDATSGTLSVEADALFPPGSDRLRPGASRWLDDCADLLAEPEARSWPLLVTGRATESPVRLASTSASTTPGDLSLSRAVRVRDALAGRSGRDPSRIGVASLGPSRAPDGPQPRDGAARIEIAFAPALP